ncbi:MAG: hypothetical protein LC777_17030 [Actinobacteria bacterium]|nr:hypothetical protein [Actinomycetota bacterium]
MDDGWWEQAQVYDIACAWETAKTWEDIDEDAERTAQHVRAQLRRLGVDVDNLNADSRAVQGALRYDTRERRNRLAARLKALGVPADAIAARVLADTNHAVPPREAVRRAPSAPRAKRARANPSEDDDYLDRAREPGEGPTTRRLDEVEYARRAHNPVSQRPDLGR